MVIRRQNAWAETTQKVNKEGNFMKAWHFVGTGKDFVLVDIPEPQVSPGKVIVDVKAAGLCHSDVGILQDPKWLATMKELPVVPGHETAGVISAVGEGVTGFKVGDRVAATPMVELVGYMINGACEEKIELLPESLIPIPDGVSFAQAAAATDAGMTSVGALTTGGVQAGMKVGIIETMKYMASGELEPVITEIGFEQIWEGIQSLMNHTAVGRLVAVSE